MSHTPTNQPQPNQTRRPSPEAASCKACEGSYGNGCVPGVGWEWEQNKAAATNDRDGEASGLVDADTRYAAQLKDRAGRGRLSIVDCARARSSQYPKGYSPNSLRCDFQRNTEC